MADLRVTYDRTVDAAYVYFVAPGDPAKSAYMYACDEDAVGGMINLDFGESGQLVGVEVLAASTKLPRYLLDSAEQLG
ncbi:DUF2283 domain-containing protein [Amycolatopsis orientalis]|uniref:DUF2283 domain-containing protein n=1 Tax=Amycolatopsis orientalis TaxID=31958 RepID=UPI00039CBC47|nr:DUF2283 domain-containing protein [Amycolatopsis orientalis]